MAPSLEEHQNLDAIMFLLQDPLFFVCMVTSVTAVCLTALAGSRLSVESARSDHP